MNTVTDGWLIESAPAEVLLGLFVFGMLVALVLLLLGIEAGRYPELGRLWSRWQRRMRKFARGVRGARPTRARPAGKFWKEVRCVES